METFSALPTICTGNSPVTTKASDTELWCFLWSAPEYTVEKAFVRLVIRHATTPIMTSLWYSTYKAPSDPSKSGYSFISILITNNGSTMVVLASGHKVRCILWVQRGCGGGGGGWGWWWGEHIWQRDWCLCWLKFFVLNIFCEEYLQSRLCLMLESC